jgi:hypothetical protein
MSISRADLAPDFQPVNGLVDQVSIGLAFSGKWAQALCITEAIQESL